MGGPGKPAGIGGGGPTPVVLPPPTPADVERLQREVNGLVVEVVTARNAAARAPANQRPALERERDRLETRLRLKQRELTAAQAYLQGNHSPWDAMNEARRVAHAAFEDTFHGMVPTLSHVTEGGPRGTGAVRTPDVRGNLTVGTHSFPAIRVPTNATGYQPPAGYQLVNLGSRGPAGFRVYVRTTDMAGVRTALGPTRAHVAFAANPPARR